MRRIDDEKAFIKEIQRFLIRVTPNGGALLSESGVYDERTKAATVKFKSDNGLAADTVVDYETFDLLYQRYLSADARESPTLKRGDRGDAVSELNMMLRSVGKDYSEFTDYPASEYFSEDTENAVMLMQERFGTEVNGIADGIFTQRLRTEYKIMSEFK